MTGNIEIINTLGATILIQNKTTNTARIDLRKFKKGLYFIKLNNQKSKFVIQ